MAKVKENDTTEPVGTEVATVEAFNDDVLRGLTSVSDAMAAIESVYGSVLNAEDFLGSGFTLLKNEEKGQLVDVPFVILESRFHPGDYKDEYASVVLMTLEDAPRRFILNDGGTGICEDVQKLQALTKRKGGWAVKRGLRVSEYATCFECSLPRPEDETTCDNCGNDGTKRGKGKTYYLAV